MLSKRTYMYLWNFDCELLSKSIWTSKWEC